MFKPGNKSTTTKVANEAYEMVKVLDKVAQKAVEEANNNNNSDMAQNGSKQLSISPVGFRRSSFASQQQTIPKVIVGHVSPPAVPVAAPLMAVNSVDIEDDEDDELSGETTKYCFFIFALVVGIILIYIGIYGLIYYFFGQTSQSSDESIINLSEFDEPGHFGVGPW